MIKLFDNAVSSYVLYASAALLFLIVLGYILRALGRRRKARRVEEEKQRVAEETARRHARAIQESRKVIQQAKDPGTIAARFDAIRDHAEKLSALAEHFDLPEMPEARPQELKAFYKGEKDRVLRDRFLGEIEAAVAKAGTIPKRAGKITYLEKALILAMDGKNSVRDAAAAREFEAKAGEIQAMIADLMKTPAD